MTKEDFEEILDSLKITVAEGINKDEKTWLFPRIVYWEIFWDFLQASSKSYNCVVTYQISFFSKEPRNEKLLELIKKLLDHGIVANVNHEYIQDEKYFHSYFSIDLLENVLV